MFRLTTKVKIASGIAAGTLALSAAGAYAASNLPITVPSSQIYPVGKTGTTPLNLVSLDGKQLPKTLPASALTSYGACVSWFATQKNIALLPQGYTAGSNQPVTISKHNFHGKLMSGANEFCKTQVTSTKTDSAETETPDATQSETPSTDSTDSTAAQGNGHANGHGKHAGETH